MDNQVHRPFFLNTSSAKIEIHIPEDNYSQDKDLKYKLRSINLVKYNPNLFTNKDSGFTHIIGGNKAIFTMLTTGLLAAFYRSRVNVLRQSSIREGIWMINLYFLYGVAIGAFYSTCYFWRWQLHSNDITALYLMKRYKGSNELNRNNIYKYKDIPNADECYNFSNNYFNHAH